MICIDQRAVDRLAARLERYLHMLTPEQREVLRPCLADPARFVFEVRGDAAGAVVEVSAQLDAGPVVLMRLDPATVGLHYVAGVWVYVP